MLLLLLLFCIIVVFVVIAVITVIIDFNLEYQLLHFNWNQFTNIYIWQTLSTFSNVQVNNLSRQSIKYMRNLRPLWVEILTNIANNSIL